MTDFKSKVTFRSKSAHQRDECLFCGEKATLEAVSLNEVAQVRCCTKKHCKTEAVRLALLTSNGTGGGKPH